MTTAPSFLASGAEGGDQPSDTSGPARGAEMRNFLQARLLQKNRAPPLVHSWEFWHDRQDRSQHASTTKVGESQDKTNNNNYEDRLVSLAPVNDVRAFWNLFNNFDITQLPLRDSVHLFHKGIKPIWEDPRNSKGGSWTFRVPKSAGVEFWKEICMMAIGEQLQEAVESERTTFRDDICGITLGVRFNSYLVQVWNRDGSHEAGINKIFNVVAESMSEGLRPRDGSYYYKKHSEHAGFAGNDGINSAAVPSAIMGAAVEGTISNTNTTFDHSRASGTMNEVVVNEALSGMEESNLKMKASMERLAERDS